MLKKIFDYSNFGYKKIFKFFGIKISFSDRKKYKNKFIPLGCNCYARTIFTISGVKPRKKHGELTLPFDLVALNENVLSKILSNKFSDFFDDLNFDPLNKFAKWSNKKYHLFFNHDNSINTKEEFVKRYNNRINNFLKLLKSQKNVLIYTIKMYDNPVDAYVLNAIYDSLSEISENQNINYLFFHMVNNTENNILNKDILNKHVKYNEIKVSQQFLKDWHKVENFNTDLTNKPFHEIYDNIKEFYAI